jgi:pyruvate dehydrogenase (quinone)/pyruvate oxidase
VLIEAVVDPSEPPMPPNVTMKQAGHLLESILKGEPNRKKIAVTIAEDKVREMV